MIFGDYLIAKFKYFTFIRALKSYTKIYEILVEHYNMKWCIKFSQIIPFLIGSHMHEVNFP